MIVGMKRSAREGQARLELHRLEKIDSLRDERGLGGGLGWRLLGALFLLDVIQFLGDPAPPRNEHQQS